MSMLLTLSQPPKTDFGGRNTHDFSPRIPLSTKSRLSPQPKIDSPVGSLRASFSSSNTSNNNTNNNNNNNDNTNVTGSIFDGRMTTPHRGLPPPSAMTLPDPGRPPPAPPGLGSHLGVMPAPPNQWQGQEESMRNWLVAKSEEDRRRQEEEKTKQESYRLEQRRIEQSMLRESLQAGMPATMVPMIYAGIGGSNTANVSAEWLQQYTAQLQAAQQQLQQQQQQPPQQNSPNLPREARMVPQGTSHYSTAPTSQPQQHQHQQILPSQPAEQAPPQPGPLQTTFAAYQSSTRPPPTSAPRSATHTQLPRLTTDEMYVHQPAQQGSSGSAHPLHHTQPVQQDQQPTSSPSIYFHHWVPPNEASSKSTNPQTPASKGDREPLSAHPGSHLSESDYKESPRKRKAQGAHQPAPAPSSAPQYTSPSFSTASSSSGRKVSGHGRSRSNTSARNPDSRPESRREPDHPPRSSHHVETGERKHSDGPTSQPLPPLQMHPQQQQSEYARRTERDGSRPPSVSSARDSGRDRPDSRERET